MSRVQSSPRKALAIIGSLIIVAATAIGVATTSPTEASWVDKVHGSSTFRTGDLTGLPNFAHATSGYGTLRRPILGTADLNPTMAYSHPGDPTRRMQVLDNFGRSYLTILRASGNLNSCARSQPAGLFNTCPTLSNTAPRTYATSTIGNFQIAASGAPRVRIGTGAYRGGISNAPVARAECTPGQRGQASLTGVGGDLFPAGPVLIGDTDDFVELRIPAPNTQSVVTHNIDSYDYKATLQRVEASTVGKAKVQLRLKVEADGWLTSWDMNIILVHAECGAAVPLIQPPTSPKIGEWADLPLDTKARSAVRRAPEASAAQPSTDAVKDESLEDSEAAESREENGQPAGSQPDTPASPPWGEEETSANGKQLAETTVGPSLDGLAEAPTITAPPATAPTTTVPIGAEAADSETVVSTERSSPASSEQTAAPEGPQDPESVRVGREFAVVNRDGVDLGTARIDDIVRTPGCGVELTLTIRTSAEAGPDRWASIGPGDFAEVRPGGSIRRAGAISSDCERSANSRVTALSAGREYEIVIAIALDDSAQRAMLRPDSTAGWVFDLPPLPKDAATTSQAPATTASPTPDAIEPSVETSVNTAEA